MKSNKRQLIIFCDLASADEDVREPAGRAGFSRSGDFWRLPPQSASPNSFFVFFVFFVVKYSLAEPRPRVYTRASPKRNYAHVVRSVTAFHSLRTLRSLRLKNTYAKLFS